MKTSGFPSPAQGYEKKCFDFNELLIKHPAATFAMRYTGNGLAAHDIAGGDILIVDCAVKAVDGNLAVVYGEGEFCCVCLEKREGGGLAYEAGILVA